MTNIIHNAILQLCIHHIQKAMLQSGTVIICTYDHHKVRAYLPSTHCYAVTCREAYITRNYDYDHKTCSVGSPNRNTNYIYTPIQLLSIFTSTANKDTNYAYDDRNSLPATSHTHSTIKNNNTNTNTIDTYNCSSEWLSQNTDYDAKQKPNKTNATLYPKSALYYYGYRYYSAELGRWINRDPIGIAGGLNVYGFVGNRPTDFVDAMGLEWVGPERAKGSRAKLFGGCGDKISDLDPNIIVLDLNEYQKWLKPEDGLPLPAFDEELTVAREFSVPNTVYLVRGRQLWWERLSPPIQAVDEVWRLSYDISFGLLGFKTTTDKVTTYDEVESFLQDVNIFGVVYQGHGPGLDFWENAGVTNWDWVSMSVANAKSSLNHGLGVFVHLGCVGTSAIGSLVTANGTYYYNTTLVSAAGQGSNLSSGSGTYAP